jgi:phage anti-repressor protein
MSRRLSIAVLALFISLYALIFPVFENQRYPVKIDQARELILPPFVVKVMSLEFRTVTADFIFARTSQYYGGRSYRRGTWSKSDYRWLYNNLIVATDLDPYFEDPYYFANAVFTWGAGAYNEANNLLARGTAARTWDWQLPFYLGFNKFYFLHDNKGGADDLLIAAKRPRAWAGLPSLAARLYSNAGSTENAIDFLQIFSKNETNLKIKASYEIRLDALKGILYLERAVSRYKAKTGRLPRNVQALVRSSIINKIPKDPYGGEFYLDMDGSIKTTSKLAPPANPEGK